MKLLHSIVSIALVLGVGCGSVSSAPDASVIDASSADGSQGGPDAATIDAGPSADAAPPDAELPAKTVFVTSSLFVGTIGGLDGADAKCQTQANGASLSGLYRAWLSDSNGSPSTRFNQYPGPYELVGGTRIADSWADLTDGTLANAINITQSGGAAAGNTGCDGGEIWTNTTTGGTPRGTTDCLDWTSNDGAESSATGDIDHLDGEWTNSCATVPCSARMPLYCFEQ